MQPRRAVLEMKNEALDEAIGMIRAAGFKPRITRNGHWHISWIDRRGRARRFTVAFSPSDWRSSLNSRAALRRLMRVP
jgi:hypothetical protein